jgi:hypothetical protein
MNADDPYQDRAQIKSRIGLFDLTQFQADETLPALDGLPET